MTLLTPVGLLALLSLPVLVVFYLFRPEPRREASTTYFLWREAAPESQGGRFADRLRSNPLMWLQLLILILMALFLARPASPWLSQAPRVEHLVLVIDRSASMQAGGAFERARERAREAVDELLGFRLAGGTPEIMLIAVDSEPQVVVPFTKDADTLLRSLESLQVSDLPDSLDSFRPFFHSLIKSHQAQIWLFSDRLPEEIQMSGLQFTSVAEGSNNNTGITSFSVRNPDPERKLDRPFMYARVENFSPEAQQRTVRLEKMSSQSPGRVEGLVFEKSVLLPANSGQTLVESLPSARLHATESSLFRLTLAPIPGAPPDLFPVDDSAFSVVPPFTSERMVVGTGPGVKGSFLLRAIAAAHGIQAVESKELLAQPDPPTVDLLLAASGTPVPSRLKVRSVFYLAPEPGDEKIKVEALKEPEANAPLVSRAGVEWARQRVQVTDKSPLQSDEIVLLETPQSPALTLSGVAKGRPSLHWRFAPTHSSLPLTPALPLLVGRFIDEYSRVSGVPASGSITTSSLMQRPSGQGWQGALELSAVGGQLQGKLASRTTSADSNLVHTSPFIGFYRLRSDKLSEHLAVNLFSTQESALSRDFKDAAFAPGTSQEGTARLTTETRYKSVGLPLLVLALICLLGEAALFLRRGRP